MVFRRLISDRRGVTAIEYALICACIFLAIVVGITNYNNSVQNLYNRFSNVIGHS